MKGLVLCAGYGSRLGRLTKDKPKCMVEIDGRPVLEHIVNYLNLFDVSEIIVNLHYLPMEIMNYFGPKVLYSYEPKLLGEKGTIMSLQKYLENEYFVVMNGDTLTNLDIGKMFKLSRGRNIRYMEGDVYAGVKIVSPEYFLGDKKFIDYQSPENHWVDMGTKAGLKKANELFERRLL